MSVLVQPITEINPLQDSLRFARRVPPCAVVIFGVHRRVRQRPRGYGRNLRCAGGGAAGDARRADTGASDGDSHKLRIWLRRRARS